MVWEELKDSLIFTNLDVHTDAEVFEKLGGELMHQGYSKDDYVDALKAREKDYPTGLDIDGIGVAIPHTDISHVNKTAVVVATLKNPVTFHEMGGEEEDTVPVSIIFMLCVSNPGGHMDQLQRVIHIIQDKSVLEKLQKAQTKEQIVDIIKTKEAELDAAA